MERTTRAAVEWTAVSNGNLNLPPRNAPALAALALGVTGLIFGVLQIGAVLGLLAIIMGVVGLRRGGRSGRAITGIVTGVLAILLAGGTLAAFIMVPRMVQRSRENAAEANLRRLARAAAVYGTAWNQAAPPHMAMLWPYLGDMSRVIRDPRVAGAMRGRGGWGWLPPRADLAAYEAALDQEADFTYAAPQSLRDPHLITFYDRWTAGANRLVAFADGHVERLAPGSAELHAAVARNNLARHDLHLPELDLDLDRPPPLPAGTASAPTPEQ